MVDDRRNIGLPGVRRKFNKTYQNAISYLLRSEGKEISHRALPDIAEVFEVHTDTNTVDIIAASGAMYTQIPLLADTGLIENDEKVREVYGTLDPPRKGEFVLIYFLTNEEGKPYIHGKLTPYMVREWLEDEQVAVNSKDKRFTKKLFEKDLVGWFRRIFQSGTTAEIDDKGTTRFETPSGTYLEISEEDEDNPGSVTIWTPNETEIKIDETKKGTFTVRTKSGAEIIVDEDGDLIRVMDSRGYFVRWSDSGIVAEALGNVVSLEQGKVDINGGNLEVLQ